MIGTEAKTEKTTTAITPIADEGDKIFAFSDILRKMEETNVKTVVPLLKKIEINTSFLKKFNTSPGLGQGKAITAKGSIAQPAPLSHRESPATAPEVTPVSASRSVVERPAAEMTPAPMITTAAASPPKAGAATTATPSAQIKATVQSTQATAKEAIPALEKVITEVPIPVPEKTSERDRNDKVSKRNDSAKKRDDKGLTAAVSDDSVRDRGGRFVGKSKSQEAKAEQGAKAEKKTILQSLKNGFEGIGAKGQSAMANNFGTIEEAAGRAVGGPFFEAAMELKGAVDSARDENTMIGKAVKWAGKKTGIVKEPAPDKPKDGRDEKGRFLQPEATPRDAKAPEAVASLAKGEAPATAKPIIAPAPGKAQAKIAARQGDIADAFRSHFTKPELAAQGEPSSDASDQIIRAILEADKSDEERHAELVKAVMAAGKPDPGSSDPRSAGLPVPRKTGPGSSGERGNRSGGGKGRAKATTAHRTGAAKAPGRLAKLPGATLPGGGGMLPGGGGKLPGGGGMLGKLGKMALKVGPWLLALPLGAVAATIAAVGAVGAAGYSAVTGKDNPISMLAQWLGLVPKLETDANGKVLGGKQTQGDIDKENQNVLANTQRVNAQRRAEGKKELEFDPVTGMVKPGTVVDAGKGYTTTVNDNGDLVKKTGARNWRNNNPGNIEAGAFADKQGATGTDGRFAVFPDYQSGRNAKEKLIFESDNGKGSAASKGIGYKDKTLTQMVEAYAPPKKKDGTFENDTPRYQKTVLAAVGGQNKKMSEYTPEERQTIMNSMERVEGFKQGKSKIVGKAPTKAEAARENAVIAKKKEETPVIEGEAKQEAATAVTATPAAPAQGQKQAVVAAATTPVEPLMTATATPGADVRERILARNRANLARAGAGSLEPKPIEGGTTLAEAKGAAPETVASLATSVAAKPAPPERMTTARADTPATPAAPAQGQKQAGADMNGVLVAALDKLNKTVAKMSGADEATRPGAPPIRTEFDDTMLTLMAYDRV